MGNWPFFFNLATWVLQRTGCPPTSGRGEADVPVDGTKGSTETPSNLKNEAPLRRLQTLWSKFKAIL